MFFQSLEVAWFITFILDGIISCFVWFISLFIRFRVFEENTNLSDQSYLPHMMVFIIIWALISYSGRNGYVDAKGRFQRLGLFLEIIKNSTLAFLFLSTINYFTHDILDLPISRAFLIIFWVLNTFFLIVNHVFIFSWLLVVFNKKMPLLAFSIASKEENALLSKILKESILSPYRIIENFIPEEPSFNLKKLIEKANEKKVSHVFLVNRDRFLNKAELLTLSNAFIHVHFLPYLNPSTPLKTQAENFLGIPFIHIQDSPMSLLQKLVKRSFDIVFSLSVLIFFSPLFLLIALLIKITSKGPVFYLQERMSLNGHHFKMIKFRSMKMDAERKTGAVWAREKDNRVTFLGRILRRTSLDELPQFYNVLKGEMSVVGPRPERPVLIEDFKKKIPLYMMRHHMKGGITGWAQINGLRGNTSLDERIKADLYYIQNWSLYFDVKIILLTLIKGFFNKNAY